MSKSSTYWDKRALNRLNEAEKTSETYIKRVKAIYEQAYKDINKQLVSVYNNYSNETGLDVQKLKELLTRSETKKTWEQMKRQGLDKYIKNNYKSRISRLEQLQAQIYAKAKTIYSKEELENTMCYKGVINQSYYKTIYDTQMGTGYNFNFSTIDKSMVDSLLTDPWSGANYSERIWGNTDILANNLSEVLGGAMLSGQGMEKTIKQIRDRFNVGKYYAERLIRTETNHFNNEVDAIAYEELGLDKYVFVATLDNRTSALCQSMDNKVFKYSERAEGVNYPPLHPNCRSKTRAYLGKEEEKKLKRRARNPITGKTELVNNMSYSEWANKNADKYGQDVINTRIKMQQNKNIDIDQYNRYKLYVGNDIESLDKFKEIKYNEKDTWENVKKYVELSKKGEIPTSLSFKRYDSNMKNVNWEAVDFSPKRIDKHFEKHGKEFGDITVEMYRDQAVKLLNSKVKDNILGFRNDNNFVFKYDKVNNEFATSKPSGIVETYYKPKRGIKYWEDQVTKYGKEKDV